MAGTRRINCFGPVTVACWRTVNAPDVGAQCAARRTHCLTPPPPPAVPGGCCSLPPRPPVSWPGLGPADPDPNYQFASASGRSRWLGVPTVVRRSHSQVRARPVGPDRCGPVTATRNRDNKEILSMSGSMSERVPYITVSRYWSRADGRIVAEKRMTRMDTQNQQLFLYGGLSQAYWRHVRATVNSWLLFLHAYPGAALGPCGPGRVRSVTA
jgi:hypothetical protein